MSTNYSIDDLVRCGRREIAQRKRVYRRLVEQDKMDPEEALREIKMMVAVLELLLSQQQPNLL